MNRGFGTKPSAKSEQKPIKPKKEEHSTVTKIKKTVGGWLKSFWRKKMLVLDITIFAATAGAIYAYGDKISELFTEQLPTEDVKLNQMQMSEP